MSEMTQHEWDELVARVTNIRPNTTFNGSARYERPEVDEKEDDDSNYLSLIVAYPCRGLYDFSDHLPRVCSVCAKEGNETHGRIVLASEDGWALLPHTIRTKEDVLRAINDLEHFYGARSQAWPPHKNGRSWYDECREYMANDSFINSLPVGEKGNSVSHDLAGDGRFSWILC